ncbi:MAG TPA: acyl-CoA dehydrogenase family protein, partial [Thermoanaerobaculia bacterium]|nr:acyl-CoA dehydrogenase family protein [Thermoanaerobaculia bacterium]
MKTSGLPADSLEMTLQSLRDFAEQRLPVARLLQLDHADEFPVEDVRALCDPNTLGIQLVFIPEEYGGFGGSAWDVYRTCELMAAIDLGVA